MLQKRLNHEDLQTTENFYAHVTNKMAVEGANVVSLMGRKKRDSHFAATDEKSKLEQTS